MEITLTYADLYAIVERSLSIIGKRTTDENGNRLFTDITLGSRETGLIHDYFRQAVIDLTVELSGFITDGNETTITLTFPSNHNTALEPFIIDSCKAYCTSFALYSWFTVTAPSIAEKYLGDCKRQLAAAIRLSHEKKAPEAASCYADVTGTVTDNSLHHE